ncbi:sigma-54 dependent transcriptional regulator [Draconibacterium sp.]|jgi:two-component system response regulator HydG
MKKIAGNILVIDDDSFICEILSKHLQNNNYQAQTTLSANGAFELLKKNDFDIVLCDYRLPNSSGLEVLQKMRAMQFNMPVVIMTAYADVRMAVKLIKMGVADYITKPIQQEELLLLIQNILSKNVVDSKPINKAPFQNGDFIKGESDQIKNVIDLAYKVAPTNMSVIIEGETGTGKEYVARFIHENSLRKDKPFVAIDCGAIPKELANSELFGHVKGSFTGALYDKEGVFQKADGGTLFLDEIGNLSYEIQLKLLRTIQERVVARVGDSKTKSVDIRVIAASNDDLKTGVQENRFREDLYHRLNEFKLTLPPLRNRATDIILFVKHFIKMANTELNKNVKGLSPDVEKIFMNYPWFGNLRELKNIVKRSVLMSEGDLIEKYCLPLEIIYPVNETVELIENDTKANSILKNASSDIEKQLIVKTIQEVGYNKSKAAKILNIDRKTLYNKMKLYNIDL